MIYNHTGAVFFFSNTNVHIPSSQRKAEKKRKLDSVDKCSA